MTRMLCALFLSLTLCSGLAGCSLFGSDEESVSAAEIDNESLSNVDDIEEEAELSDDGGDLAEEAADEEPIDEIAALDDDDIGTDEALDEEFGDAEIDESADDQFSATNEDAVDQGLVDDELDEFSDDDFKDEGDEFALEGEPNEPVVDIPEEQNQPVIDVPAEPLFTPTNKITNLEYKAFQKGGTVVIETESPAGYQTFEDPDLNQMVVQVDNVFLPERFKRPYITKDFKQDIATINAYAAQNSARFVIQMKRNVKPSVQKEGNSILVMMGDEIPLAYGGGSSVNGDDIPEELFGPDEVDVTEVAGGQFAASANLKKSKAQQAFGDIDKSGVQLNAGKFTGDPISLEFSDTPVRTIIEVIADKSGVNLIMDEEVSGNTSLRLREVPWDQALLVLLRSQKLGYVKQGNVLRIAKQATLSSEAEDVSKQIQSEKKAQLLTGGLKVKYLPVSYANVSELSGKLKEFLSKEGKITFDDRTSSLVVTDYAEYISRVTELVKALDTPPLQVEIESKLVEAREEFTREAGINWDIAGAPFDIGGARQGTVNSTFGAASQTVGGLTLDLTVGTFDIFGNLTAALNLFERQNKIKVLSQPRIVTLNKTQGSLRQVTQVPIQSIQQQPGQLPIATFTFQPLELSLVVTPQITFRSDVILDVTLKREFTGVQAPNGERELNSREAKTTVMVKNGKTAVIGGIYQLDDTDSDTGIPVLKDIPLLGYLFKRQETTKNKNDLLLFLKPKIIKEVSGPMVSKTGPPGKEFDAFEELSVDEGEAEAGSADQTEKVESQESFLDLNEASEDYEEFDEDFAEDESGDDEELTL